MRLIAHRAKLENSRHCENTPQAIMECVNLGIDAEVDIWRGSGNSGCSYLYLGHDKPETRVSMEFLIVHAHRLWLHAKSVGTLSLLTQCPALNVFFHQNDAATLTSRGYVWVHPEVGEIIQSTVLLFPEKHYPLSLGPGSGDTGRYSLSATPGFAAVCTKEPLAYLKSFGDLFELQPDNKHQTTQEQK